MFALGFLLISIALSGMTGRLIFVQGALVIALAGAIVAYLSDRPRGLVYTIEEDTLTLRRGNEVERIPLAGINDASLLDRRAARDMLMGRVKEAKEKGMDRPAQRRLAASFTKWCSVDIGMRTFTFGIGRDMIDRRPDAKHDVILLRLRNGHALVLSPIYNQDMVESLHKSVGPVHESRFRDRS